MLKLMKLELRKFKLSGYIRGALIANVIILGLLLLIGYTSEIEKELSFTDFERVLSLIETFVRATFVVFASVLIWTMVIGEFKSKSMTVMFLYPINRKKIMIAKLLVIVLFTFSAMLVSLVFVTLGFAIAHSISPIVPDASFWPVIKQHAVGIVMNTVAASIMSLIPLYFGMRSYSGPATILSSFLIVVIVCQYFGDITLYSFIIIPITLALIGAYVAYLAIRNVEKRDIL
ncbi:ABC transporter permease [Paenibacillus paridis]|uniref:ABC transporter permease n=1 Tax=Paenibacillus paridis TaxID=2583376 RepID=UPI0011243A91|nr:ABC transporter permease [Paenibacillus paridis]